MADCYKCYYRSRVTLSCDYILLEGHSRGCGPENCDKFKQRSDGEISPYVLDIMKLYYKGWTDRMIAKHLGISRYAVAVWRYSFGLESNYCNKKEAPRRWRTEMPEAKED